MEKIGLNDNKLLVEPFVEKQVGNIVIPETARKKQTNGKVINAGKITGSNVKVGYTVHYPTRAGVKVEIEDKEYVIIDVKDVMYYIPD